MIADHWQLVTELVADIDHSSSNWDEMKIYIDDVNIQSSPLSITPQNGILAGNYSDTLSVSFDATSLFYNEDYFANIVVSSNDPYNPSMSIPYSLHIEGIVPPIMNVDISSIHEVIDKGSCQTGNERKTEYDYGVSS